MIPEACLKIAVVGGDVSGGNDPPFPGPATAIPRSSHADVPLLPENRRGPVSCGAGFASGTVWELQPLFG